MLGETQAGADINGEGREFRADEAEEGRGRTVLTGTDAGLLFAPSRDGISHNPKEWTDWADCAAATQVLASALATLAGTDHERSS